MGKQLKKWSKRLLFILSVICLLWPIPAFAVEYEIPNVEINAYLQSNGNVLVKEQFTYVFTGEFGGIIREIIPKEGTNIVNLKAYEGKKELPIETNEYEHRIHRAGADEQITVDLVYEIENGVNVYQDVAEFYWPFFDQRNESSYQDLIINIYPPSETDDVIAFGYDEAFQKEIILEDGVVQFLFGYVLSHLNGDIRVVYDAQLFPDAPLKENVAMKESIKAELAQMLAEEEMRVEKQTALENTGEIVNKISSIFLICLLAWTFFQAQLRKRIVLQQFPSNRFLPDEQLSMPGTIYFMKRRISPELISVSLLDLVRKGKVKRHGNRKFAIVSRNNLLDHEKILVEWLFDDIGNGKDLFLSKIKKYMESSENRWRYKSYQLKWRKALNQELNASHVYQNIRTLWRMIFGMLSVFLFILVIRFYMADVGDPFFLSFLLMIVFCILAIVYQPKTRKGHKILFEWKYFKKQFPKIADEVWQNLSEDDKMRVFLFSLGTKDKLLQQKNESLVLAFTQHRPRFEGYYMEEHYYFFDNSLINAAYTVSDNFRYANQSSSDSSDSSSSSSDSNSGVGGGGGGSGAF